MLAREPLLDPGREPGPFQTTGAALSWYYLHRARMAAPRALDPSRLGIGGSEYHLAEVSGETVNVADLAARVGSCLRGLDEVDQALLRWRFDPLSSLRISTLADHVDVEERELHGRLGMLVGVVASRLRGIGVLRPRVPEAPQEARA